MIAGAGGDRQPLRLELREEPREFRQARLSQAFQGSWVGEGDVMPQRLGPRPERQDLLALVRAPEHDPAAAAAGFGGQLRQQPALADAGLTDDGNDSAATGPRLSKSLVQAPELDLAPNEWRVGGVDTDRWRRLADATLPEDLLVQLLGLGLRPGGQLPMENLDALLVL